MKNLKEICRKLLFLPVWVMMIISIVSTAALVMVLVKGWDTLPISYVIYVMSFYSLTVICISLYYNVPRYYKSIKNKIYSNKFGNKYMTDVFFKTHVSLYRSLAINLIYVVINLFWGYMYQTVWFIIFAIYYGILAIMRFLLLRYINKNKIGEKRLNELKRSRLCAIILLLINIVLTGAVLMILYFDRGFEYNGIFIYVMAMYTFYITTSAIINIFKYRKYNSPVMLTSKIINLAAALVSMLALETAMLSQFGNDNSPQFRKIMVASTGAGVSVIIITMSVYIIVRGNREIRKIKMYY